jgi:hypothetical protein
MVSFRLARRCTEGESLRRINIYIVIRQVYERQEVRNIRWINNRNNSADAITKGTFNHAFKKLINTN